MQTEGSENFDSEMQYNEEYCELIEKMKQEEKKEEEREQSKKYMWKHIFNKFNNSTVEKDTAPIRKFTGILDKINKGGGAGEVIGKSSKGKSNKMVKGANLPSLSEQHMNSIIMYSS